MLTRLAYACYIEGRPPASVGRGLKSPRQKKFLAAVSLYSMRREDLIRTVEPADIYSLQHFYDCRSRVEKVLHQFAEAPFRRWPEQPGKRLPVTC